MARMTRPSPTFKPPAGRHETESASAEAAQTRAEQPELTTRQADVIELAMLGLTNSQIAQRLNLSTHAIKFNLSAAYRKLAVANRTQAAVAYLNYRAEDRH
jgi:DNA-binding NarL/FixJ family response regulator